MNLLRDAVCACAELCEASYALPDQDDQDWCRYVTSRLPGRGFSEVRVWITNDTELLAATFQGPSYHSRIYCFRGSSTIQDWLANITSRRVNFYDIGRVHAGFCYSFRALANGAHHESIEDDLAHHRDRGRRVIFAGHSKGAAVATVMAANELRQNRPVHGLVTFGSPRVVDADLSSSIQTGIRAHNGEIYRFVNQCDPVAMVPTAWRFRHVAKPHYFSRDGSLKIRPTFLWMLVDRFILSCSRPSGRTTGAWGDHSIAMYGARVKDKLGPILA